MQEDRVTDQTIAATQAPAIPSGRASRDAVASGRFRMSHGFLVLMICFWAAAVLIPVGSLLFWSFMRLEGFQLTWSLGLDAYRQILDTGRYGVILTTLRIAATVTLIELVIAVPVALWLAKGVRSYTARAMALALLTIPFFVSLAARTIVFRPVLGRNGAVNTLLMELGLTSQPLDGLLFSEFAVHLGLLGPSFPSMILPIFLAMALIDDDLVEASRDLGAGPLRVFFDIVLPLSMPGIVAGIVFTFVPMLGETVVPQLLGGANIPMLGPSMSSLVSNLNYPAAAALSVIVLLVLTLLLGLTRLARPRYISFHSVFEGLRR
jgi:ABC-type spermidine/putrescine transport system permease subunit I